MNYCKTLFSLTKPGIIFGNLVAVIGGYFLAQDHQAFQPLLFLMTLLGSALVVACGCVINNIIDKDIDGKMERTCKRALVTGSMSSTTAAVFAFVLGILGFSALYFFTTIHAFWVAVFGWFVYVVPYSLYFKRYTIYGALVGSLSGAAPPLIGYCAITNHIDLAAILLFLAFCFWQIPHSYAIYISRERDYQAANLPVLPRKKGLAAARLEMLIYIAFFMLSALSLSVVHATGYIYFVAVGFVSARWFYIAWQGPTLEHGKWAKKVFLSSILVIMVMSAMMSINLP